MFIDPSGPGASNPQCAKYTPWARALNVASNYGVNCRLGTSGGQKLGNCQMPAQIYYVLCGMNAGGGWWRGFKPANGACAGYVPGVSAGYYREVHNGGINVGFVDGHSKWVKSDVAFADSVADWNTLGPWTYTATTMAPGR